MSKTLSGYMESRLYDETTSLAILFKLTRPDGVVFGFTDHDEDLIYSGVTYKAASGNFPTAMSQSGNLSVDNIEASAFLSSDLISEVDIIARKYDYSTVDIYLVFWDTNSFTGGVGLVSFPLILGGGWKLGEVTIKDNSFSFEIRSKTQILQQQIIELYSPDCRADLGDTRCKVTIATYTVTGTVTGVTDNRTFSDSSRTEADNYFNYGLLTWTSGDNNGMTMEIKDYTLTGGGFVLVEKMGYTIQVGDTYSVYSGCDKLKATCRDKFNNVINFRGEPYLPGMDELLKIKFT
jgi:uncharacterized phage protein (TIGR02218 family)